MTIIFKPSALAEFAEHLVDALVLNVPVALVVKMDVELSRGVKFM